MTSLLALGDAFARRGMHEAALPVFDRSSLLVARHPAGAEIERQAQIEPKREFHRRELGAPPPTAWRNMAELDRVVTALLASGRAASAAEILEKANPPERSSWEVLDRMATLRLHLGEPARRGRSGSRGSARRPIRRSRRRASVPPIWPRRTSTPRIARIGRALDAKPGLFEACYGLAVLEQDAGEATAAYELATRAVAAAPDDRSREAAARIAAAVERFAATAGRPEERGGSPEVVGTPRVRETIGSKIPNSRFKDHDPSGHGRSPISWNFESLIIESISSRRSFAHPS